MTTTHRFRTLAALLAAALLAATPAFAQDLQKLAGSTPEQRAGIQTEIMKSKLGLSGDALQRVAAINLKYAQQMQPVLDGSEGTFRKMEAMRGIQEAKEAELRGVLTDAQVQQLQAAREEIRQKLEEKLSQKAAAGGS